MSLTHPATFTVRPFSPDDYAPLAAMVTAIFDYPATAESIRIDDAERDAKYKVGRFVAEVDGQVVAYGEYGQGAWAYHPRRFFIEVAVMPDFRGRGIGSALYGQLMAALAPFEPIGLNASARESCPEGMRFLASRGFEERMRNWESHLDVATVDVGPHLKDLDRALAQGYEIKSYPELADFPDRDRKLHALMNQLRKDVPSVEQVTDIAFEEWIKGFSKKEFWPEGYFVALKDGAMVGVHALWKSDDADSLHNGLTAVAQGHRGTGLAMAMKIKGLEAARSAGYAKIRTWNESNNQRMLAINIRLGFARKPAWVQYRRTLADGE